METLQQNIWEETDLTEHTKSCLNNNDNEQNVITNDIKNDLIKSQCEDIGKREREQEQEKLYNKNYYKQNKEKLKSRATEYYRHNRETRKQYRIKNKPRLNEYNKKYYILNKKSLIKYRSHYCKKMRATSIKFRLTENLRTRLTKAIHRNQKVGSAVRDLGCPIEAFKNYITSKFQRGMSWDNYGKWHLDHIIPLSTFNLEDRAQFLTACHYTNYQPLWGKDNIRKSNKLSNLHNLHT